MVLTDDQHNEAVMTILVSGKAAIVDAANDVCIEYLAGQRRDTVRQDRYAGAPWETSA